MFWKRKNTNNNSEEKINLKDFNKTRPEGPKEYICYAPFKNIYFNIHGDAAPCWLTFSDPDSYPEKSIKEIWSGDKFQNIREHIKIEDLNFKCKVCKKNLENSNYLNVLSRAYDNKYKTSDYPVMMELEIDNTCNLECVMCNGKLSSSIRKNRENKSALNVPYNKEFANQLEEFIPHLEEIRFNGGEPFLSQLCFDIWEKIIKIKPEIKVVIATNGTVLNDRIKTLLSKGNFHINISIDSLKKKTYEAIRVNASFEKTMGNFKYFLEYCKERKTTICILVNPMRINWQEMPDFIDFCNNLNIPVWFNTIHRPQEYALWTMTHEELKNIYSVLSKYSFTGNPLKPESFHNKKVYHNLVQGQIKTWMNESGTKSPQSLINSTENKNSEIYFYELLQKHFPENKENKISIIKLKLEEVLTIYPGNIDKNKFYALLADIPVEMIITEIESKSTEELVKQLMKLDL